jgi:hypothetical protein
MNLLAFQMDTVRAQKAFERALQIDPGFGAARLRRVLLATIDIYLWRHASATVLVALGKHGWLGWSLRRPRISTRCSPPSTPGNGDDQAANGSIIR